jgi:hypothetical protein
MDDIYVNKQTNYLYVIRSFDPGDTCSQKQTPSGSVDDPVDDPLVVKNRTLFSLAVALLELTYGAPLSSHKIPDDLNDTVTRYRIAVRLTEKIQKDELRRFASVVFKCMYPSSECCDFTFTNEGFRRHFFQEVLLPLKKDYEELFPQRTRRLLSNSS